MDVDKLKKMASAVRTGGKGSVRRKKKAVHKTTKTDDKRLQSTLKRIGVNPIPAIEEVNIFKDDVVIQFSNPKVQASIILLLLKKSQPRLLLLVVLMQSKAFRLLLFLSTRKQVLRFCLLLVECWQHQNVSGIHLLLIVRFDNWFLAASSCLFGFHLFVLLWYMEIQYIVLMFVALIQFEVVAGSMVCTMAMMLFLQSEVVKDFGHQFASLWYNLVVLIVVWCSCIDSEIVVDIDMAAILDMSFLVYW